MGSKYDDITYSEVRQRLGYDEFDDTHDGEIDMMSRKDVFDEVCTWNGLIGYGYLLRKWANDIFDVDVDAQAGEDDYSIRVQKAGKYSDEVYRFVRQRLGYDEFDGTHDGEIDMMERSTVFNEVCNWEGLVEYGETVMEWIECVYGIDLWEEVGEERPW